MNTKKIMKVISVLFVIFAILSVVNMVMGASIPTPQKINGDGATQVSNIASRIIYIVQVVCYAAAFIMLLVLGIKFISASPDGKAEIKKSAVIYVIGALLVFGAGLLLGVINNLTQNVVGQ